MVERVRTWELIGEDEFEASGGGDLEHLEIGPIVAEIQFDLGMGLSEDPLNIICFLLYCVVVLVVGLQVHSKLAQLLLLLFFRLFLCLFFYLCDGRDGVGESVQRSRSRTIVDLLMRPHVFLGQGSDGELFFFQLVDAIVRFLLLPKFLGQVD